MLLAKMKPVCLKYSTLPVGQVSLSQLDQCRRQDDGLILVKFESTVIQSRYSV